MSAAHPARRAAMGLRHMREPSVATLPLIVPSKPSSSARGETLHLSLLWSGLVASVQTSTIPRAGWEQGLLELRKGTRDHRLKGGIVLDAKLLPPYLVPSCRSPGLLGIL